MVTAKGNLSMETLVAGLFDNGSDADAAIRDLKAAGFMADKIQEFGSSPNTVVKQEEGGFMSALGRFFTGEPEQTTTTSTGATLSTAKLVDMGLSAEDAEYLQQGLSAGDILLILHAGTRGADALEILKRHNASPGLIEFNSTPTTETATPKNAPTMPMDTLSDATAPQRIELLKEVLRVNKERVQRGEVRLRKEVISETQTIEVPTTREELVIERHPVTDGQAASGAIGEGQEIRVTLNEDRVTTEKRAIVAEEVTVGKREVQETKQVSDTVRREELRSDHEGDVVLDSDITDGEIKKPVI